MAESPGAAGLGEVRVKMAEESGVSEMEQARGGIRHYVEGSWDEGEFAAVAVVALMFAGALAKVGSGAGRGGGAFEHSGEGWSVVGESANGAFSDVEDVGDDVEVADGCALFQVAVGDVAMWVSERGQAIADGVRQRGAPNYRPCGGRIENAA